MPKKNRLIPFSFLPASWGLSGRVRDEAEANYYLTGEELERRLAEINGVGGVADGQTLLDIDLKYNHVTQREYDHRKASFAGPRAVLEDKLRYNELGEYTYDLEVAKLDNGGELSPFDKLDIDLKHKKITQYEYDVAAAELDDYVQELDKEKALLYLEFKHGKITKHEYAKKFATMNDEPWVAVLNTYEAQQGINGVYLQFDWNDQWIELLKRSGYGHSNMEDDQIVELWFSDLCRSNAGDPTQFEDYGYEPPPPPPQPKRRRAAK